MLVVDDGFFTCEVSVQHKFQVVKKKLAKLRYSIIQKID